MLCTRAWPCRELRCVQPPRQEGTTWKKKDMVDIRLTARFNVAPFHTWTDAVMPPHIRGTPCVIGVARTQASNMPSQDYARLMTGVSRVEQVR